MTNDKPTMEQAAELLEKRIVFVELIDWNGVTLIVDGKYVTIPVSWRLHE